MPSSATPLIELGLEALASEYPALKQHGGRLMAETGPRSLVLRKGLAAWWGVRDSMAGKVTGLGVMTRKELELHLGWVAGEAG